MILLVFVQNRVYWKKGLSLTTYWFWAVNSDTSSIALSPWNFNINRKAWKKRHAYRFRVRKIRWAWTYIFDIWMKAVSHILAHCCWLHQRDNLMKMFIHIKGWSYLHSMMSMQIHQACAKWMKYARKNIHKLHINKIIINKTKCNFINTKACRWRSLQLL